MPKKRKRVAWSKGARSRPQSHGQEKTTRRSDRQVAQAHRRRHASKSLQHGIVARQPSLALRHFSEPRSRGAFSRPTDASTSSVQPLIHFCTEGATAFRLLVGSYRYDRRPQWFYYPVAGCRPPCRGWSNPLSQCSNPRMREQQSVVLFRPQAARLSRVSSLEPPCGTINNRTRKCNTEFRRPWNMEPGLEGTHHWSKPFGSL